MATVCKEVFGQFPKFIRQKNSDIFQLALIQKLPFNAYPVRWHQKSEFDGSYYKIEKMVLNDNLDSGLVYGVLIDRGVASKKSILVPKDLCEERWFCKDDE